MNFYGMFSQEGDDAVAEVVVKRAKQMYWNPSQIRVALMQFAVRNPQFEEAATETVFTNVVNEVLSNNVVAIDVIEE